MKFFRNVVVYCFYKARKKKKKRNKRRGEPNNSHVQFERPEQVTGTNETGIIQQELLYEVGENKVLGRKRI
jgi:hypothetical protein